MAGKFFDIEENRSRQVLLQVTGPDVKGGRQADRRKRRIQNHGAWLLLSTPHPIRAHKRIHNPKVNRGDGLALWWVATTSRRGRTRAYTSV